MDYQYKQQIQDENKKYEYKPAQINLNYLQCTKGNMHQNQLLNTVCVEPKCRTKPLCCCACIEQEHAGHKTKTLKKLMMETDEIIFANEKAKAKSQGLENNNFQSSKAPLDLQMVKQMIQGAQQQSLILFTEFRTKIQQNIKKIQSNLQNYFSQLKKALQFPHSQQTPLEVVKKCFSNIQTVQQPNNLGQNVQKLMKELKKQNSSKILINYPILAQNIQTFVNDSLYQVSTSVMQKTTSLQQNTQKFANFLQNYSKNIEHLMWENPTCQFDQQSKCQSMKLLDYSISIRGQKDCVYQMALMNPFVGYGGDESKSTILRFKVTQLTANWIAVGIAHKNIVKNNKYLFNYSKIGHGAYMISANGGTWSHTSADFNNKVKAFKFQQGDIISCIVNFESNIITFVKQRQPSKRNQKLQTFELQFTPIEDDPLYPCVTVFYQYDQVQYLPTTNFLYEPRYDYLFSTTMKHPNIKVFRNGKTIISQGQSGYKACLLDKPLNPQNQNQYPFKKSFSFKIAKGYADWIAVGMCHKNIAQKNNYGFIYEELNHGYYMISSNGGSWSSIEANNNNIVKAFTFSTGSVIDCQVEFNRSQNEYQNTITFKCQQQTYSLNFAIVQSDPFYPCVMFHYEGDQVAIEPTFSD